MPDEGIPVIKMKTSESFWRSPWFHWVILPAVAAVTATGITSVSATTTTGGALFARAGLVDGQLATAQFAPVEFMNGFLGFCIQGRHGLVHSEAFAPSHRRTLSGMLSA